MHYLTKCCPVSSTSCELCTSKAWYCYIPRLGRRCIYKKIHYLTSRSHEMFPSTLYIMWIIKLQSMKLLYLSVYEEKHLQEMHYLTLTIGQGNTKCCPVPSTSCDLFSYKVWSCYVKRLRRRCIYKKIQYLSFDLDIGVKVTWNITQYPLHYVTYSATKFIVATSNR